MKYLLDTNILIYRLKNLGNVNGNFLKKQNEKMSISVITYGELIFGAEKSKLREKNLEVAHEIRKIFPVENITSEIMECFGCLKANLQKTGKNVDDMDLLIAATAISNDMVLVTHNTKHFINIPELQLEDWF